MLNSLLLPLNGFRLFQIKQMLHKVSEAEHGHEPSLAAYAIRAATSCATSVGVAPTSMPFDLTLRMPRPKSRLTESAAPAPFSP